MSSEICSPSENLSRRRSSPFGLSVEVIMSKFSSYRSASTSPSRRHLIHGRGKKERCEHHLHNVGSAATAASSKRSDHGHLCASICRGSSSTTIDNADDYEDIEFVTERGRGRWMMMMMPYIPRCAINVCGCIMSIPRRAGNLFGSLWRSLRRRSQWMQRSGHVLRPIGTQVRSWSSSLLTSRLSKRIAHVTLIVLILLILLILGAYGFCHFVCTEKSLIERKLTSPAQAVAMSFMDSFWKMTQKFRFG